MNANIIIDPEFRALIPPLSVEEYNGLQESIEREGCRDALVVEKNTNILLDGHNRYELCAMFNKTFKVHYIDIPTRDEMEIWIYDNQFNRRNLAPYIRAELALKREAVIQKRAKENQRLSHGPGSKGLTTLSNLSEPVNTRAELAKIAGVSEGTISKVKVITEHAPEEVKDQVRKGEVSINKAYKETKSRLTCAPNMPITERDEGEPIPPRMEVIPSSTVEIPKRRGFDLDAHIAQGAAMVRDWLNAAPDKHRSRLKAQLITWSELL